ncbi:DUF6932 family protein [Aureimonas sp. N4]|uniref:DUF6932 family protein n=1 Tax=Aureimonas sp. N4 TaxID=1638165 RepID=UPI0007847371|nr:hypothetical protein [Aureimonas sp. N4]
MFNAHGYLEPGFHDMDSEEMSDAFVNQFPNSTSRAPIFSGFKAHSEALTKIVSAYQQFINGSFTTNKNDPGDVDLVVFADMTLVDNLSPADQEMLTALVAGKSTKDKFMCDAYFCVQLPEDHPQFPQTRAQRKYWMGEFGFDRVDIPKGIVRLTVASSPAGLSIAESVEAEPVCDSESAQ